ncbi:MAG: hypothetical protein COU40_01870 [Candidatus Moranbacteria bacterium CG10_big_fil_rev_8_21_14_0_10_35_21]|nr:MAG: hypothetical protein COU40_01870 [Candidatus Moranbacteria bacterium CG10_big_fil_rev_8_21_14_0_10_35_21]PJA88246.1 MAG: hypothetical protein CO139_04145 [Candidatus Moranbacteria bacterium CG_4_9_14_3_um_filter_36_9]
MNKSLIYFVSFYGTPPLNFFQKYLEENDLAKVTIVVLPFMRQTKKRLLMNAFILDENGRKIEKNIDIFFPLPFIFKYIIQYFLNFYFSFKFLSRIERKEFDICIAEPSFGATIAYLLKKFKKCKFTVYMNGDILADPKVSSKTHYLPQNKINKFFDSLLINVQYFLRKIAYKNDLVWYPSGKIKKWDNEKGYFAKKEIIAPAGVIDFEIVKNNINVPKSNHSICYIGRLDEYAGLDIAISSLKIIRKEIPDIEMVVVGGANLIIEKYKRIAKEGGVLNHIKFYGFVPKTEDAIAILARSRVGLALYKPVEDNVSLYTEPGKVKDYFRAGLPVIMAKGGPDICSDIERFNAGVVVGYNKEDVAQKIINILTNQQLYEELQKGVLEISKKFEYRENFKNVWNLINEKANHEPR